MATKKQKRMAGIAKHERRMAELKRSNASVLQQEVRRREDEHRQEWQKQHDSKHDWKTRLKECPLCQDIVKAISKGSISPESTSAATS